MDSTDMDGDVTSWEWFVDGVLVDDRPIAQLIPPVGITLVTLVVADDQGGQAGDEIKIIRPGLRSGEWRGVTSQGLEVSFNIFNNFWINIATFGHAYEGFYRWGGAAAVSRLLNTQAVHFAGSIQSSTAPSTSRRRIFPSTSGVVVWRRVIGLVKG